MNQTSSPRARRARTVTSVFAAFVAVAGIVACEGTAKATGPGVTPTGPALNEIVTAGPLNASSTDTLVYYSFATGTLVASTADWDVAFRRFEVRLNGGISGSKGVLGYSMQNTKTLTDTQIVALTVANTLAAFDSVRAAQIPAASAFVADALVEDNTAYASFAGAPSANPVAYWLVRTANGGYADMRITAIAYTPAGVLTSITVESRIQSGNTLGAVQQVTVPVAGATAAISLVNNAAANPSGCNWDFQVDAQTWAITVNTGCSVGTFPGPASPAFANATAATGAPQYGAFLSGIAGAIPNAYNANTDPFRYNLQGNNRLSPTFNIWLLQVGTSVYKLQVINYYSETGASGYPTIRYARIK